MLLFYPLCYAAVLLNFTYHAQNYAQELELSLVYIPWHEKLTTFMEWTILEGLFY